MKTFKTAFTISTLALSAASLAAAPQSTLAQGKSQTTQNITVIVDGNGYHPSSVKLKAGKPVRLTFLSKGESCANAVSIPALKKNFNLKPGQKKAVVFTPKQGQSIAFACSMNMFKGKAVAR